MKPLGSRPLGHRKSALPELLDGRKAQRQLARAALREWRKLTAKLPADDGQDGDQDA